MTSSFILTPFYHCTMSAIVSCIFFYHFKQFLGRHIPKLISRSKKEQHVRITHFCVRRWRILTWFNIVDVSDFDSHCASAQTAEQAERELVLSSSQHCLPDLDLTLTLLLCLRNVIFSLKKMLKRRRLYMIAKNLGHGYIESWTKFWK